MYKLLQTQKAKTHLNNPSTLTVIAAYLRRDGSNSL